MVTTQEVTKTVFLEMYARKAIQEPVYTGTRIYGRTPEQQAKNPDGYIVVYCVV